MLQIFSSMPNIDVHLLSVSHKITNKKPTETLKCEVSLELNFRSVYVIF